MDRETAESLMASLLKLSEPLNSATHAINRISDKEEQAKARRVIGEIMNKTYTELMMPIIRQYPDLDPDK